MEESAVTVSKLRLLPKLEECQISYDHKYYCFLTTKIVVVKNMVTVQSIIFLRLQQIVSSSVSDIRICMSRRNARQPKTCVSNIMKTLSVVQYDAQRVFTGIFGSWDGSISTQTVCGLSAISTAKLITKEWTTSPSVQYKGRFVVR